MKDRQAIQAGHPVRNEEEVTFASDGHREASGDREDPHQVPPRREIWIGVLGVGRGYHWNAADPKRARKAHVSH